MNPRKRRRRPVRIGAVVLLLLVVLAVLVSWFPADWAWRLARGHVPQLQLRQPSGTVWDGHAAEVVAYGRPLGTLDWHLSRSALWGDLHGRFDLEADRWKASGRFARLGPQQFRLEHLVATLPAALAGHPAMLRGMAPGGTVHVRIGHARLRNGWPVQGTGRIDWTGARLSGPAGQADLGHLVAHLTTRAGTALTARFSTAGDGPVALSGHATATSLGWRLDATLTPRRPDPTLVRVLTRFGQVDADGRIHVRRHAGLF